MSHETAAAKRRRLYLRLWYASEHHRRHSFPVAITVGESDAILGTTFSFPRRTNCLSEIVRRTRGLDNFRSVTGGSHQVSSAGILVPPTPFEYGSITNPLWSIFYIL